MRIALRLPLPPAFRISALACGFVGLFSLSLFAAAAAQPASSPGARLLEERFHQLDRNRDGKLTREEADNAEWFDRLDRRGAGVITIEQLRALAARVGGGGAAGALGRRGLGEANGGAGGGLRGGGAGTLPGKPPAADRSADVAAGSDSDSPRVGPKVLPPADRGIGRLVPDLAFTDLDGRAGKLSDYRSSKALVIAFTSTSCPITKKYAPSLARLEREFTAQGVAFLFVNPIASDAPDDIRAATREHALAGRYVHDATQQLAAALGARTTAEMFVLDAARTLVFRGAVDDQYGLGYSLDAPRRHYLKDALAAVLAGQLPAIAATEAPGCALDLPASSPAASLPSSAESASAAANAPAAELTYHNRISRIVLQNCVECHREDGVGPFSLETYEDVRSHAGMMRKQVSRGAMPPWFAAPPAEGERSHWKNDRSLLPDDKADLLAWLAGAKPEGDPTEAALPRTFPADWAIGKPDLVLELPRAVAIKAEGTMPYQMLTVETRLDEDKWIAAYEVQPTASEVVHHVTVRVRPPRAARADDENPPPAEGSAADEREGFFAAYVPGHSHAILPEGFAKKLPAGSTLSFQMHYTPNGAATTDRTRIGLVFSEAPPRHVVHVTGLVNGRLRIPAGAPDHAETAEVLLPFDTTLLSFLPHMHVRGKAARYEAILPDGSQRTLLDVPRYDFNWQLQYEFAEPLTLPRGTKLVYTAWYDNSAGNSANPDPAKTVRWGPQTFDEMLLGYVEYFVPAQRGGD